MSQTGANLLSYLQQKTSAAYTGYLDNTKANNLFKDALISLIEKVYRKDQGNRSLDEIKDLDEITFVTNVKVSFVQLASPNSNLLITQPLQIINVVIANATTFTITTNLPHYLLTGTQATISGVLGTLTMNTANGTFTVTVLNSTSFNITVASATGVYTANTGQVITTINVLNYWHLLAIKPKYTTPVYGITVTGATNYTAQPITVTFSDRSLIRTGTQIVITGVAGNTNANGTFYVQMRNPFNYTLFSDINFQTPIIGNGKYTSGGTVSVINQNYASPLTSKMKQGVLNIPTPQTPYFEIANNLIKIHPMDQVCGGGLIDYIATPTTFVNVADAVTDLTMYYPEKFLFRLVDEASTIFAQITRDLELLQVSNLNQQKNP